MFSQLEDSRARAAVKSKLPTRTSSGPERMTRASTLHKRCSPPTKPKKVTTVTRSESARVCRTAPDTNSQTPNKPLPAAKPLVASKPAASKTMSHPKSILHKPGHATVEVSKSTAKSEPTATRG